MSESLQNACGDSLYTLRTGSALDGTLMCFRCQPDFGTVGQPPRRLPGCGGVSRRLFAGGEKASLGSRPLALCRAECEGAHPPAQQSGRARVVPYVVPYDSASLRRVAAHNLLSRILSFARRKIATIAAMLTPAAADRINHANGCIRAPSSFSEVQALPESLVLLA